MRFAWKIIIWLLIVYPAMGVAELYRWTDENGKVHFSDRKPNDVVAADQIDQDLKPVNVDESRHETQKLRNVFPDRDDSRQRQAANKKKAEQQRRTDAQCSQMREHLRKIKGPVYFVDEEGNEFDISERERKERQKKLEQLIVENC
ncbi:DUF4124 domain-containing protein [Gilvimarinus sp. SDUM040013]|uniref:DUF4124 domain-containing protein n=1 Tax=Gilvimarinus gilvus TaxID=3058038 RepID=A0ABU4RXC1_9GAMM|nr:DUF4124 domain-containing protein [Gilvimarinus sp. SDUM040013]MDO3388642.1 DUF4124 domain-containing protein [Gilvimarinus sp. SDUM040013]MDX6849537.1 DUF4124 domain-containing protein [Gilvimarinus sp. SDUM040013]